MNDKIKLIVKQSKWFWKVYLKLFPNKLSNLESRLFELIKNNELKSIIQIGSNDGINGDPLFKFIKSKKLESVLVEPIPFLFNSLKINYKNANHIHFVNKAIGDKNGNMKIYYFSNVVENNYPKWILQLGSFNKNHGLDLLKKYPKLEFNEEYVQTTTVEDLIEYYYLPDLLHIDTEGYDFEVIKTVNLNLYKPKFILFENVHLSLKEKKECEDLLTFYGYKIIHYNHDSFAYLNI